MLVAFFGTYFANDRRKSSLFAARGSEAQLEGFLYSVSNFPPAHSMVGSIPDSTPYRGRRLPHAITMSPFLASLMAPIQNARRFWERYSKLPLLSYHLRDVPLFQPTDARPTDEETGSVRHKRSQGADRFSLATTGQISGVRLDPNRRKRVHLRPTRLTGPPRSPG